MILKLDNITKSFNGIDVVKDFSLQVYQEEILCIVGPSGCGKSTLLHIISGLMQPSGGEITHGRVNISYVFQEDRLLPWKNVYENIKIVNKNASKEKCMELIQQVGLKGFESYYPSELSGGMRQRCSIARAFYYERDILLMDEPFKSLDYHLRIDMINYLLKLWNTTKTAIIFVTHDIDEALMLGDRILLLSTSPAKNYKEFHIQSDKMSRNLEDFSLQKIRTEIIQSFENKGREELHI